MTRAFGVDVSHWKPVKDWHKLASAARFFGAKATEGQTYVDSCLRTHRAGFRKSNMLLGIYYHFARSGDPQVQAERLQTVVGDLDPRERLCLDLEVIPTAVPFDALRWVEKFFATLMRGTCTGRRPLLYTSKRIWQQLSAPTWDLASEIDLWVPRYSMWEPELPSPWAEWKIWQFTDGEQPEVLSTLGVGRCDANWFNGDEDTLRAYASVPNNHS